MLKNVYSIILFFSAFSAFTQKNIEYKITVGTFIPGITGLLTKQVCIPNTNGAVQLIEKW